MLPWIKGRVFCSLGATDADWEYFIKQFRIAKDSPLQGSDLLNLLLLLILEEQSISEDGFEYFNNTKPENEGKHNSYLVYFYTKSSKSVSIKNRDASITNQNFEGDTLTRENLTVDKYFKINEVGLKFILIYFIFCIYYYYLF